MPMVAKMLWLKWQLPFLVPRSFPLLLVQALLMRAKTLPKGAKMQPMGAKTRMTKPCSGIEFWSKLSVLMSKSPTQCKER